MSLAVKHNDLTVSELKLPSPSDLCLGQISLKNCKDATIGTKIDGNIIVNQFFNDIPADKAVTDGLAFTDSVVLKDWTQKLLKYKYVWISLILAVVMTAVLCILYIPQNKSQAEDTPIILNFTEALRTRQEWSRSNAETPCHLSIDSPARYVVIGHTVTIQCRNPLSCETTVVQLQNDHKARGRCDISYNFVIGDDGYIYEGRGWAKLGTKTISFSCSSLAIGLVGNFNLNKPSNTMINSLNLLLTEGVNLGHISSTYKLIAQSQLNNWGSPGINIEALMKKWDHWSLLSKEDFQCPNTSDI